MKDKIKHLLHVINKAFEQFMQKVFPYDKCLHIIVGCLIALVALLCTAPAWLAAIAVCIAAVLREAYNKFDGGKFAWLDILYTCVSGFAICCVTLL